MKGATLLIICTMMIYQSICHAGTSLEPQEFERGEVAGRLMKSAMYLDSYFQICFPSTTREMNYLNGVATLVKNKWHMDVDQMLQEVKSNSGRDIWQEAYRETKKDLDLIGGCQSEHIGEWKLVANEMYNEYLEAFHDHK